MDVEEYAGCRADAVAMVSLAMLGSASEGSCTHAGSSGYMRVRLMLCISVIKRSNDKRA